MNESRLKSAVKETHLPLFFICLACSAMGLISVTSATLRNNEAGQLFGRESIVMAAAVGAGIVACLLISFMDYEVLTRKWFIVAIAVFCVGIMLSLKVIGAAPADRPDAKIWIQVGGIYLQPSELVKLGFILSFAAHLNAVGKEINKPRQLLPLLIHGGIYIGLVTITGDMGSALVFLAIFGGLLFMAGVKWYYFAGAALLALAAMPVAWLKVFNAFQKERFIAVYPRFFALLGQTISDEAYNTVIYQQQMGVNAISGGGLTGQGLFTGEYTQSGAVPVNESDMIFSVVGEEMGFLGAAALFLLLAAVVVCCALAGRKSRDETGKLICAGVALMVGVQAIINIGMCLKFLPCIGITLPFISAGGSSNLSVWLGIGLVMSVFRHSYEHGPSRVRFIKRF
ncbi:MAG: FtsW/RodA/SpoVE family cell cycle protein [Clostridium sp.]|jgi:rod shape determining protein RodA|nr:FtsW/RodA/SpoVE family cell cycle protein [Clostridium sp.]